MSSDSIRVLMVEDDPEYSQVLSLMLGSPNPTPFQLTHKSLLAHALPELAQERYDVILLDLTLPDSEGIDTFLEIQSRAVECPVVVLTGIADEELALRTVREGAQDYLIKSRLDKHLLVRSLLYAIERHQLLSRLQRLSLVDELTGLLNRRGFNTIGRQHIGIARRAGRKLLLFFADVDGLKQINDRFGHPCGDYALKSVAEILKSTFRSSDVIGRYGGDEFAVLAVDAKDQGEKILARLRTSIEQHNHNPACGRLSLSVGCTRFDPSSDKNLEDLLAEADAALYHSRNNHQPVR